MAVLTALLAGCASDPQMTFVRTDGQRGQGNPALEAQYLVDKAVCEGEAHKANMSGTIFADGSLAGLAASSSRAREAKSVAVGCMAGRGYLSVPVEEADARLAELAAIHAASTAPSAKTAGK